MIKRKDGYFLLRREIICLYANMNDFSGWVKNDLSFGPQLDKDLQVYYTWSEDYNVPYTTGRIKDMVSNLVPSNLIRGWRRSTASLTK